MRRMTALIASVAALMACQGFGRPQEILVPPVLSRALPVVDSQIAFTSNRDQLPEPKNFEPTEIYLMNGNGSDQRRLSKTDWNEGAPDWSPNGLRIAFHGNKLCGAPWTGPCNKSGLFLMNVFDPAEQTLLTNLSQKQVGAELGAHFPSWSPDGQRLAFNSWANVDGMGSKPPQTRDIFVINVDGTGLTNLTQHIKVEGPEGTDVLADDFRPDWSPDGRKIAFTTNRDGNLEIYLMNADGTGPTRLTNNTASDRGPKWSPDGTQIAFESNREGNWEIYVVSATDGRGQINLTNYAAEDANPAWSPDGGMVAFSRMRLAKGAAAPHFQIFTMKADGTLQTQLTFPSHPEEMNTYPSWGPASRAVGR
jgi:Tol biopolymer transport system component